MGRGYKRAKKEKNSGRLLYMERRNTKDRIFHFLILRVDFERSLSISYNHGRISSMLQQNGEECHTCRIPSPNIAFRSDNTAALMLYLVKLILSIASFMMNLKSKQILWEHDASGAAKHSFSRLQRFISSRQSLCVHRPVYTTNPQAIIKECTSLW